MLVPKTSKECVKDIQRGGLSFRQKDPDKASSLIDNQEVRRTTRLVFLLGREKSDAEARMKPKSM